MLPATLEVGIMFNAVPEQMEYVPAATLLPIGIVFTLRIALPLITLAGVQIPLLVTLTVYVAASLSETLGIVKLELIAEPISVPFFLH